MYTHTYHIFYLLGFTKHHSVSPGRLTWQCWLFACMSNKLTFFEISKFRIKSMRRFSPVLFFLDPDHGACPQDGFLAGDFLHHIRHPPDLFTRESSPIPPTLSGIAGGSHSPMNDFSCHESGQSSLPESVRSSLLQLVPNHVANGVVAYVQDALSSSAMEHHHSVMLEQGYDSMFCEAMASSSLQHT